MGRVPEAVRTKVGISREIPGSGAGLYAGDGAGALEVWGCGDPAAAGPEGVWAPRAAPRGPGVI